ncbi:MAG: PEGA domain-containing protein [Deltaproteobacteria bacterium]|nr:PEGA domain-containing protein [Deltaproteobacteria bacterium]
MAAFLTSTLLLLAGTPQGQEIVAQQRVPIALLLVTPKGNESEVAAKNAGLIEWLSEAFDRETDLLLERLDLATAAACEGDLTCLVLRARPDYNRVALESADGTVDPYAKHLDRVRKERIRYPRYLLLLTSLVQKGQPDRLAVRVVDTDLALSIYHSAARTSDWKTRVDTEVLERAVRINGKRADVPTREAAVAHLEELFNGEMRALLDRDGHWRPFGAITFTTNEESVAVLLDGVAVGISKPGTTRISNVPAGRHTITLEHPLFERFVRDVEVERGATVEVPAGLVRLPSADHATARTSLLWTGVGVSALGAAVLTAAIIGAANQEHNLLCYEDEECRSPGWYTFDGAPDSERLDPSQGVLIGAPLGYSLMGAGAVWSLGTLLFGSDESFPWIQIATGVGVGALSFGVSAALNPK